MNVSELFAELAALQAEHGDIDVFVHQDEDGRFSAINCVDLDQRDEMPSVSIQID